MKVAVFSGSIANGFALKAVVESDEDADEIVVSYLAKGYLAESLEVSDPAELDKSVQCDEDGKHFVVFGNGLGNPFSVYGPFADLEVAESFGQNQQHGDVSEVFTLDSELELGKWYVRSSYDFAMLSGPYDFESDAQHEIDTDPNQAGGVTYQHE